MSILLMTPGPTRVPERVLHAGAQPMIHHRDPEFSRLLKSTLDGLRSLFGATGEVLPVHATGRGAMEGAICNFFSPGDELLAFSNGRFGEMWSEIAERSGVIIHRVNADWNRLADSREIETALESNPAIKGVLVAHSDTSTGALNNVASVAAAAKSKGLIVLVDGVSSVGGVPFQFDDWNIDFAVTSTQKCLMSSPGMSFVAISEKAWKLCESSRLNKSYFDFPAIRKSLNKSQPQTPGTTPVHLIMQVNAALSLIHEEGVEKVFARHDQMGKIARDWASEQGLSLQCPDLENYSPTITAIKLPDGQDPQRVREQLKQRGILVARGIGRFEINSIRIGHMGDIRADDLQHTLNCLTEIIKSQGGRA